MTQLVINCSAPNYIVVFVHLKWLGRYVMLDFISGLAFFALGRMTFNSDILCLLCNIVGTQMLHYVLPTPASS